jgi:hypothetical protein
VYLPKPSLTPTLTFDKLDSFLVEFENLGTISGGVAVYGPAAAYALVWEYGAPPPWHIKKPGPKTLWGTNALGETKIMTRTAPDGYIAIHHDDLWPLLEKELSYVKFSSKNEDGIRLELEVAVDNATQAWARMISDSAPVDSGDLRSGIDYVESKFGDIGDED